MDAAEEGIGAAEEGISAAKEGIGGCDELMDVAEASSFPRGKSYSASSISALYESI